jgi:hypothetical protein
MMSGWNEGAHKRSNNGQFGSGGGSGVGNSHPAAHEVNSLHGRAVADLSGPSDLKYAPEAAHSKLGEFTAAVHQYNQTGDGKHITKLKMPDRKLMNNKDDPQQHLRRLHEFMRLSKAHVAAAEAYPSSYKDENHDD